MHPSIFIFIKNSYGENKKPRCPPRNTCNSISLIDVYTRALISYSARKTAQREFLSDDDLSVRQLVRHFFLLGANTMMRSGELYRLKWDNIETYTAENQRLVKINVLAETSKVQGYSHNAGFIRSFH